MKRVLPYNLNKPYKMVVSATGTLVIQNGIVYEAGSGKVLGPVNTMLKAENPSIVYCKFSGATFPNTAAGKIALQEYQERKGLLNKESDGTKPVKESSLAERQDEIKNRRDKIKAGKS